MPLYDLKCHACDHKAEDVWFDAEDPDKATDCPGCGLMISVANNRDWSAGAPRIQGDTCSGSVNYAGYFDPGLNTWVKGRGHRREIMKERGLTEYTMEPVFQETGYIRKHSRPGDVEAKRAIKREYNKANAERKEKAVKAAFDNATPPKL